MSSVSKYSGVDRCALQHFKGMHDRVRDGKSPSVQWPREKQGYLDFCNEIGPIPCNLSKSSVGRKDHSKGYEEGNIQWEEFSVNSVKRKGTKWEGSLDTLIKFAEPSFRKGTDAHREHQKKASNARWAKQRKHQNA